MSMNNFMCIAPPDVFQEHHNSERLNRDAPDSASSSLITGGPVESEFVLSQELFRRKLRYPDCIIQEMFAKDTANELMHTTLSPQMKNLYKKHLEVGLEEVTLNVCKYKTQNKMDAVIESILGEIEKFFLLFEIMRIVKTSTESTDEPWLYILVTSCVSSAASIKGASSLQGEGNVTTLDKWLLIHIFAHHKLPSFRAPYERSSGHDFTYVIPRKRRLWFVLCQHYYSVAISSSARKVRIFLRLFPVTSRKIWSCPPSTTADRIPPSQVAPAPAATAPHRERKLPSNYRRYDQQLSEEVFSAGHAGSVCARDTNSSSVKRVSCDLPQQCGTQKADTIH
ncbi:unnamed protein product [Acanthoscelides obtectus]|uniref:Uncharacterized protein n=1 Tax=Acanthoscelides obtectus TaxID=200917 RepID=A0A9P0LM86_ACAOB|nr:unnamed protein product [Acanthoscelides obtectus]CAK1648566.1 hypothetical protein AOBTE_LOCUS15767 [Acanthoscelides obtectus]